MFVRIVTGELMASGRKTKSKYITFENRHSPTAEYHPVNIYTINTYNKNIRKKKNMCRQCFEWCFCGLWCEQPLGDEHDNPIENPNSSLVGPVRHSYNLTRNLSTHEPQQLPVVTVTRVLDELPSLDLEFNKDIDDEDKKINISTTTLLLSSEQAASSISLDNKYKALIKVPNRNDAADTPTISHGSLKSGEKGSFIRDVLSCRDSFLKSLEWCDNSLTRSKKCRYIRSDDWVQLESDGTSARFKFGHSIEARYFTLVLYLTHFYNFLRHLSYS